MKLNRLALACGIALATVAGQAAAQAKCGETGYDVYSCAADVGYDMIYLTGASAPDNFLETTITSWLDTGYTKITDGSSNYRAFVGRTKNAAPVPAAHRNKSIRFIKRSAGGSVWGVNPVARDEFVRVLDVKNTTGNCSVTAPRTCPLIGADGVAGLKPTFGVSDVSPKMFKSPLNVEWDKVAGTTVSQLSASETNALTIKAANTLMMGIVATDVVPATTNFTRSVYGDLLRSGGYADWSQVDPALTAPGGPLEAKPQVVVCRRVPGSGTQTSYNWFFGGFPCTLGAQVGAQHAEPKRMGDSAGFDIDGDGTPGDQSGAGGVQDGASKATAYALDVTAGMTVIENLGSGNVRECMEKAQNGGVYTFQDETDKWFKVDFGTGGYGAVGVLSVDSLDSRPKSPAAPDACNATTGQTVCGWSFRNLDGAGTYVDNNPASGLSIVQAGPGTGIAPSKANLTDGKYDFAAELTFQYVTSKLAGSPVTKSFVDELITAVSQPAGNTQAWVAALPPASLTPNTAKASRGGNQCGPLQYFY